MYDIDTKKHDEIILSRTLKILEEPWQHEQSQKDYLEVVVKVVVKVQSDGNLNKPTKTVMHMLQI